jgi:hypothetical protein
MVQSRSGEANSRSARQEIIGFMWIPEVLPMFKSPSPVPVLSQMNPVHIHMETEFLSTYVLLDVELMFKTKFIAFLSVMGFWK